MANDDPLLQPEEVAGLFGVTIKTIARWSDIGKLRSVRTAGGHRRYPKSGVDALLTQLNNKNTTTE
ncbi:MerR family DNA-binding transcriptional regulator [Streptomyces sp. NPDC012769]|uniref:MerR family DNA-binding transcriptional regulator n=1 Tax=Streptomyces sp. NPDC012769 TaxID=3364848 RepID=UPI0036C730C8